MGLYVALGPWGGGYVAGTPGGGGGGGRGAPTWQRQKCDVLGWQVDLEAPVTCFRVGLLSHVFGQIQMLLNF